VAEAAPAEVVATKVVEPAPAEVIETTEGFAVAPHKRQCGCPCKCDVVEPPVTQINPAIVNTSTDVQPVDIIQPVQDIVQPVVDEHVKPVYSETVNPTQINHTVDPCTCACSSCSCTPEAPVRAE
jgi:hypothetical protein